MTTIPQANLLVSFVISTHNRRGVLLDTLASVFRCGLERDQFEIFVVDNASTDDTANAVRDAFPDINLIRQETNCGACAKNVALPLARGRFIVFLDDDSYPRPGSIERMIRHFEIDPRLGAAVFTIHLPDGSHECSAYPDVFIGCGTGFRKRALTEVGGLPEDFFMQAEEYDLSLRLLHAGWRVKTFGDLHVTHLKTPLARRPARVMRLDVRNNLLLARRYFPHDWRHAFARDWLGRYYKIAAGNRQRMAFLHGAIQGLTKRIRRTPIDDIAFESFAKIRAIEQRLRTAQQHLGLRSVLFVDLGKNVLPFWMAAKKLGIHVVAIADQRLSRGRYRGIPIIDDGEAQKHTFDAAVVSNLSPVHAIQRRAHWRRIEHHRPVIDLFEPGTPWDVELDAAISAADRAGSESRQTAARSA